MGLLSKHKTERLNSPAKGAELQKKPITADLHAMFRQVRILKERLAIIEAQMSVLRRDVSRIDRNSYRQAAKAVPQLDAEEGSDGDVLVAFMKEHGLA